jgi:phosphatidylglycerol:prolipoprotein diacylglycerol transferase
MFVGWRRGWLQRTGTMTALLLLGYGLARFVIEYVREPDAHLGQVLGLATMGQILCLPMLVAGGWILWRRA